MDIWFKNSPSEMIRMVTAIAPEIHHVSKRTDNNTF